MIINYPKQIILKYLPSFEIRIQVYFSLIFFFISYEMVYLISVLLSTSFLFFSIHRICSVKIYLDKLIFNTVRGCSS